MSPMIYALLHDAQADWNVARLLPIVLLPVALAIVDARAAGLLVVAIGVLVLVPLRAWCRARLTSIDLALDDDNTVGATAPRLEVAAHSVPCPSGLPEVAPSEATTAQNAWSSVHWQDICLRVGPNYKQNKRKRPTKAPLLPLVGVDIFQAEQKVFCDGIKDAAYLPAEIVMAAAEAAPAGSLLDGTSGAQPPLPRYVVVCVHMPTYSGPATDGPNARFCFYLAVPSELRRDPTPGAALLCEFLDGSAGGHRVKGCKFYDRFKVIVRARHLDATPGWFLGRMMDSFNGKPMLWRFFDEWGSAARRGSVCFLNLDFMTGGRMKNAAFAEGVRSGFHRCVFEISWTIEARADEEMPERLLGGAAIVRPRLLEAPRLAINHVDGTGSLNCGDGARARGYVRAATAATVATARADEEALSLIGFSLEAPAPAVLRRFLAAREAGDVAAAAACCTANVVCACAGVTYEGLEAVVAKQFATRAQCFGAVPLVLVAQGRQRTRWARRVLARDVAPNGTPSGNSGRDSKGQSMLQQEFTVIEREAGTARISRIDVWWEGPSASP